MSLPQYIRIYVRVCVGHFHARKVSAYISQNNPAVKKHCSLQEAMAVVKKDVKSKVVAKKWLWWLELC